MDEVIGYNLVDDLAERLSEQTGVPFRVDAWKNQAPSNYGVVELTGQNAAEWADGHMIDQAFTVEITLYVSGKRANWIHEVQKVLEIMDAGYSLPERKWLPDIEKTAWTWRAVFFSPIEERVK